MKMHLKEWMPNCPIYCYTKHQIGQFNTYLQTQFQPVFSLNPSIQTNNS